VLDQVPDLAFAPAEAAAIQSEGRVICAIKEPVAATEQFAGGEPVKKFKIGAVLTVVSTVSSLLFLKVVEY
jgi:hypothetical protein